MWKPYCSHKSNLQYIWLLCQNCCYCQYTRLHLDLGACHCLVHLFSFFKPKGTQDKSSVFFTEPVCIKTSTWTTAYKLFIFFDSFCFSLLSFLTHFSVNIFQVKLQGSGSLLPPWPLIKLDNYYNVEGNPKEMRFLNLSTDIYDIHEVAHFFHAYYKHTPSGWRIFN